MPTLNLKNLDPAELMPLPEIPESYGPWDDEDGVVHALIQEALDSGSAKQYAAVAEFSEAFRTRLKVRRKG